MHTHSHLRHRWAQAGRTLPCFGHDPRRPLLRARARGPAAHPAEIDDDYEQNTGVAIVDAFQEQGLDPLQVPAVLVPGHAPFAWGATPAKALENAIALEASAKMAIHTLASIPQRPRCPRALLDKHFLRKHGPGAYYGQA